MVILLRDIVEVSIFLILVVHSSLSKEIPQGEERKKESLTKDSKVASASYTYSKSDKNSDFDRYGPSRFSSDLRLNSGLDFPRFNYPTKYKIGSYDGVVSSLDDLSSNVGRLGLGVGRNSFDSGISSLDDYGPPTVELGSHGDTDDLLDQHKHENGEEKHYEKGGESSEEHESAAEGESSKGYKNADEFSKGVKSERVKNKDSGHQDSSSDGLVSHVDEAEHNAEKEESARGAKGEHSSHSEGHKKGQKTKGFHNVYHKDEYKKDTTFYDDEHEGGSHEEYSQADENYANAEAAHKHKQHSDAAYQQEDRSNKGFFTNGHQYGLIQGHGSEHGLDEHHQQRAHNEASHESASHSDSSKTSHR